MKTIACAGMLLAALSLFSPGVLALDVVPAVGVTCSQSGSVANNPNANGTMNVLWCNGSTWQPTAIKVGAAATTCSGTTEGTLSYDSGAKAWTFCNGTSYVPFNTAAGTAKIKTASSTAIFYPTAATCSAPSCDSGYTSFGCSWGSATNLLGDASLDALVHNNLVTRMITGFNSTCTATGTPGIGLFNKVTCARLCKSNT